MTTATLTRESILAMEAGAEMDALVAERVMGFDTHKYPCGASFWPSKEIADAWRVVEKVSGKDRLFNVKYASGVGALAQVVWRDESLDCGCMIEEEAPTAPLAICRAALLATLEAA